VPTWNYAAVHVYGTAQIVDSREALRQLVERTVQVYESMLPAPWQLDARASYVDGLLDQIVGFRIAIERVEAKFKLSQNQPLARQQRVAQALAEQGGEAAAVAALMSQRMHKKGSDS
jgi:transcriptional regulator